MAYEPRFTVTPKILDDIIEISKTIVRMEYIEKMDTPRLRRINRLRSLHSSLAIEGNSLSLDEVTAIIDGKEVIGPKDEIKEILNADTAYKMIDTVDPYDVNDLLKMHKVMMDGLIDSAGSFRTGDEGVFDVDGNCIHLAPGPDMVPDMIGQLLEWIKESDYHVILKSCVLHYGLEYIHPFDDGNGRMGRLWQTILLSEHDSSFRYLPVESMIRSHQADYYDALAVSNSSFDCTPFIEFMTGMIRMTLKEYTEEAMRDAVGDDMTVNEMRLFSIIRDGHFRDIGQAAKMLNVSIPTVNRCLKSLKDNGAIRKVGNKRTGRWEVITHEMMIDHTDSVKKE